MLHGEPPFCKAEPALFDRLKERPVIRIENVLGRLPAHPLKGTLGFSSGGGGIRTHEGPKGP